MSKASLFYLLATLFGRAFGVGHALLQGKTTPHRPSTQSQVTPLTTRGQKKDKHKKQL